MSNLTDGQVAAIAEAVVLAPMHGEVLSEFEAELIREVGERFRDFGRNAVITPAEQLAFGYAAKALRQAEARAAALDLALEQAGFRQRARAA